MTYQFVNKYYQKKANMMKITSILSGCAALITFLMYILTGMIFKADWYILTIYLQATITFAIGIFIFRYMGEHCVMMDRLEAFEAKQNARSKSHIQV